MRATTAENSIATQTLAPSIFMTGPTIWHPQKLLTFTSSRTSRKRDLTKAVASGRETRALHNPRLSKGTLQNGRQGALSVLQPSRGEVANLGHAEKRHKGSS